MAVYGYARVSTLSQDTDVQVGMLKEAGCSVIRTEKVSGASRDGRTELQTVLDFIVAGDTLVACRLDRLGRSTRDVLNIVHELDQKGAFLRVLDRNIDTSKPEGKLILTVLSMVSEMELTHIKERQRLGIEAAKAKGVYKRKALVPPPLLRNSVAHGQQSTKHLSVFSWLQIFREAPLVGASLRKPMEPSGF